MGKNFNGTQINQSPTISEKAGADVADIRNLILKYDTDGNVVVAADGTAPLLGVSIIEGGYNDISGVEAGNSGSAPERNMQPDSDAVFFVFPLCFSFSWFPLDRKSVV